MARPGEGAIQSSLGVVNVSSGTYRPWRGAGIEGVMRTDAARFHGFAGGPLIDASGSFVGVNVYGNRRHSSLTLPLELINSLLPKLESGEWPRSGYLGVRTQTAEVPASAASGLGRDSALLVVGVEENAPASNAGMLVGDIIVALGNKSVTDHESLLSALAEFGPGKPSKVVVIRGGESAEIDVTIGERPPEDRNKSFGRGRKKPYRGRR